MRHFILYTWTALVCAAPAYALTCLKDYGGIAGCSGSSEAAGDCTTLGYSKEDVTGCDQYLYCPFDTSYKRCAQLDCEALGFTRLKKTSWCSSIITCPVNALYTACTKSKECTDFGYTLSDKSSWCSSIIKCPLNSLYTACTDPIATDSGSTDSGDTSTETPDCTGYTLSSCPTHASCSGCGVGTNIKYKVDSCDTYYVSSSGSCDYSCKDQYEFYKKQAFALLGNYLKCTDTATSTCPTTCPTSTSTYPSGGAYWKVCMALTQLSTTSTSTAQERCLSTSQNTVAAIKAHNTRCSAYSSYQVDKLTGANTLDTLSDTFLEQRCKRCIDAGSSSYSNCSSDVLNETSGGLTTNTGSSTLTPNTSLSDTL